MKPQPCYLLVEGDDPANASFCESISEAKDQFCRQALPLANIEQYLSASVFFVEQQGDEFGDYPDRVLRMKATRTGSTMLEERT
jgi:hypothetical protein